MTSGWITSQERPEYRTGEDNPIHALRKSRAVTDDPVYARRLSRAKPETILALIDDVMFDCPPAAWKVLCLIFRETAGCGKVWAAISYKEMCEGTGIASHSTIANAISWLDEFTLIERVSRKDPTGGQLATEYSLDLRAISARDR